MSSADSDSDSDKSSVQSNNGKRKKAKSKKQKAKKKPGRKSKYCTAAANDLVDIIVNNDNLKSKLIFQNTKNQQNGMLYEYILKEMKTRGTGRGEEIAFTVQQLRTKFKKCVGECKKAALTIKTASGIKRFQDSKNYGLWFDKLFALVKTRDSCRPDLAIEPEAAKGTDEELMENRGEKSNRNEGSQKGQKLFFPVRGRTKKNISDTGAEALKLLKELVENDTTKNVIDSIKEEMEKSRQHELKLFQMMCQTFAPPQPQPQNVPQPSFPPQFIADDQPSTSFVNHGFSDNMHTLQPVILPPGFHPFSASLPLSNQNQHFGHNPK